MNVELKRAPSENEVEQMCTAAEEAARKYILSKVSVKKVDDIDVTVEALGDKPLSLSVDVALEVANETQDMSRLVDEATDLAFSAAEAKAKELSLCKDTRS